MKFRVGILGFLHESNTFLPASTTWEDFAGTSMTAGEALLERWTGTHHELGGMIAGCAEGLEVMPGFATYAVPSGTIDADSFERIADALVHAIDPGHVDGLLVALHGATVSADYPDADGEILRRLRDRFGANFPIVVTLDLHANVSAAMVRHATAITAYRSNPHMDQRERGIEAAGILGAILRGELCDPVMALESPPIAIPIAAQYTGAPPCRALYDCLVDDVLACPGIVTASVCLGFYYADVAEMGTSFLAVAANGDADLARRAVKHLSDRAWELRDQLVPDLPRVEVAVRDAMDSPGKPVALMDIGDNVGGGGSAASTVLFEECLRQNASKVLVILFDPTAVDICVRAGVRAELELPGFGSVRVRTISDGLFTETQVRHGGWTHCDQGVTAVVETPAPGCHTIVFTSRRMAPMSLEQILSLGIHPERMNILIVKGAIAPQAAYRPVAARIILVDTPGPTANDPRSFTYRHRRVPLFPIERW